MKNCKFTAIFEIDEYGDVRGLYTDEIDLFAIGKVTNVVKASEVEFDELSQHWMVLSLDGKVLHTNKNREAAIDWEIKNFGVDGIYYHG